MRACDTCHRRKVRCDSKDRQLCSNCRTAGIPCSFELADQILQKRKNKRRAVVPPPREYREIRAKSQPTDDGTSPQQQPQNLPTTSSSSGPHTPNSSVPLVLTDEDIAEQGIARTALANFIQHGINSQTFRVFDESEHKPNRRLAYVGTSISNLSNLVNTESLEWENLHFPFPPIRPMLPWKPDMNTPRFRWNAQIAHDMSFLPTQEVRDALVEAFFTKIHPGFPIIDEAEFRSHYASKDDPPPLIILQAVLLAGAHVCQHPKVAHNRSLVKTALFRRAKALFDLRYENDRTYIVQAALLFTWHFEGADDASANFYYWAGVACRVAFALGMHRDHRRTRLPSIDRRMYRRCWWTVLQIEVLTALNHGRPLMVNLDDCDQPPLVEDDFLEADGQINTNIHLDYCVYNAALCEIIIDVMKLYAPGTLRRAPNKAALEATRATLDGKLAGWILRLPPSLANATDSFWAAQLHLHYNITLLHLHRTPFPPTTPPLLESSIPQASAQICGLAAAHMAQILDWFVVHNMVDQCWFTALMGMLSVAIQTSLEIRWAVERGAVLLAVHAQGRLEGLFPAMQELAGYWPSAEAILKLFRELLGRLKEKTAGIAERGEEEQQQQQQQHQQQQQIWDQSRTAMGVSEQDWGNIFGVGDVPGFGGGVISEKDWSEIDEWLAMPGFPPQLEPGVSTGVAIPPLPALTAGGVGRMPITPMTPM